MNISNFVQTEGYPLTGERLQELQTSFSLLTAYGNIAGNLTIIAGCEQVGSNIENGVVFINGEPIEFRKAALGPASKVIIIETPTNRAFKNGNVKTVYTVRYATFGTAATSWLWTDFKRPIQTKELEAKFEAKEDKTTVTALATRITELEKKNAVFQAGGGMVLWNKPAGQIPPGWREVVDWQARMPVGFKAGDPDFGTMGKPGGDRVASLTVANLPAHYFQYQKAIKGRGYRTQSDDNPFGAYETANTNTIGGNQAFPILNPYKVVLFIEYIG